MFYEKDVLKKFAKFTGKHLLQSLFLNKVAGLWPIKLPMTFKTMLSCTWAFSFSVETVVLVFYGKELNFLNVTMKNNDNKIITFFLVTPIYRALQVRSSWYISEKLSSTKYFRLHTKMIASFMSKRLDYTPWSKCEYSGQFYSSFYC